MKTQKQKLSEERVSLFISACREYGLDVWVAMDMLRATRETDYVPNEKEVMLVEWVRDLAA